MYTAAQLNRRVAIEAERMRGTLTLSVLTMAGLAAGSLL